MNRSFHSTLLCACLLGLTAPPPASAGQFSECIPRWQQLATDQGLPSSVVAQLIPALSEIPRVLELDQRQPEFTSTFAGYLKTRLTSTRIERGQILLEEQAELLARLTRQYGVPGRFLVAFWGLETNFGSYLGNMSTLNALATLACDERRSAYFTRELLTALDLVQRQKLDPAAMTGSWAGAMGHTQFMPSNYAHYGVDGDGDGRIDLWGSIPDALSSAANFLQQLGWDAGVRWGREVSLPTDFDYALAGLDQPRPLEEWRRLGLRHAQGGPLPVAPIDAALLVPAGHTGPAFLAYQNFRVIMRWNRSEFYALSVGLLADRIAGAGPLVRPPPQDTARLSRASIEALQSALNRRGFDAGTPDGILGPGTHRAISRFQASRGMIADGYHAPEVFAALQVNRDTNDEN